MVLESQDDLADLLALAVDSGLIFITEARALLGERQVGKNGEPKACA